MKRDVRASWIKKYPEDKKIIEEKYDEYLKAEVEYARSIGWTEDEIQRLLIDDNYQVVSALVSGDPTGEATEVAGW